MFNDITFVAFHDTPSETELALHFIRKRKSSTQTVTPSYVALAYCTAHSGHERRVLLTVARARLYGCSWRQTYVLVGQRVTLMLDLRMKRIKVSGTHLMLEFTCCLHQININRV